MASERRLGEYLASPGCLSDTSGSGVVTADRIPGSDGVETAATDFSFGACAQNIHSHVICGFFKNETKLDFFGNVED